MWDELLSFLCYKVFRIKLHNFISSFWPISFNILQILVSKTVNKIWIWVSFCFKYTLVIWNLTFAVSCFMAPVHEEEIEFLNCDFFFIQCAALYSGVSKHQMALLHLLTSQGCIPATLSVIICSTGGRMSVFTSPFHILMWRAFLLRKYFPLSICLYQRVCTFGMASWE